MLFSGIGVMEWKNKLKIILMDFPFQQVDGFLKIYLVEPRAKRLSHEGREGWCWGVSALLRIDEYRGEARIFHGFYFGNELIDFLIFI